MNANGRPLTMTSNSFVNRKKRTVDRQRSTAQAVSTFDASSTCSRSGIASSSDCVAETGSALACLPKQLRAEGFIDQLTPESRTRHTNAALGLVIPHWRMLVTGEM